MCVCMCVVCVSDRGEYMSTTSIAFRVLTVTHLQLDAHVSVRYKTNSTDSSQSYVEIESHRIESKKKKWGQKWACANDRELGAMFVCLFVCCT